MRRRDPEAPAADGEVTPERLWRWLRWFGLPAGGSAATDELLAVVEELAPATVEPGPVDHEGLLRAVWPTVVQLGLEPAVDAWFVVMAARD